MMFPNRILVVCGSCGAKMYQRARGLWYAGYWVMWMAFVLGVLAPIDPHASWGVALLIGLVFSFPFNIAYGRLYHAYWLWRHPLRCEKGGHAEPSVEGT